MDIKKVLNEVTKEIEQSSSQQELQNVKVAYLGKKGKITELLKSLKDLSLEEKKSSGSKLNLLRIEVDNLIKNKFNDLKIEEINSKLKNEYLDISFPPPNSIASKAHPISKTFDEVITIFGSMGYSVAEGPDIETDFFNFSALNIPENHPARDMQDTFYLDDNQLLRTHTSPMQVRIMENNNPPIKIISPGKVYRCDSDVTHTPMFHQVEGLFVDENVSFANLKSILNNFCIDFFKKEIKTRFRPSYFPFTEPSAELDIEWENKNGEKKWMEVLGCGLVNPKVFESVNYDPNQYSGFAFGMGIERLAMIKLGITDIRYFYQNDLKFLKQF